jgi:hypothetical protein
MMGQTAENLAWKFGISRQQMDAFSVDSHKRGFGSAGRRLFRGDRASGLAPTARSILIDDGVRHDSSIEGLAKLKPFFDRKYGKITPGNSSQITDGAAVARWPQPTDRSVSTSSRRSAQIADAQWAGPTGSGADGPRPGARGDADPRSATASASATFDATGRSTKPSRPSVHGLRQGAREDPTSTAGSSSASTAPLGALDAAKLNVDGGAVALGHLVGASPARASMLHLLQVLQPRADAAGASPPSQSAAASAAQSVRSRLRRGRSQMSIRLDYRAKPGLGFMAQMWRPKPAGVALAPLPDMVAEWRGQTSTARERTDFLDLSGMPADAELSLHPLSSHAASFPDADGDAQPSGIPAADLAHAASAQPPCAARGDRARRGAGFHGVRSGERRALEKGVEIDLQCDRTPRWPQRARGHQQLCISSRGRFGPASAEAPASPVLGGPALAEWRMPAHGRLGYSRLGRLQSAAPVRCLCAPPGLPRGVRPPAARHRAVPRPSRCHGRHGVAH